MRPNRLSDYQLAVEWTDHICGQLFFSTTYDAPKHGEFYKYLPDPKGGKSCRIRYLKECEVEASILDYLVCLNNDGENIRITPAKIRSVRTLAALMLRGGNA